jgi:hypothetical protein
LLAYLIPIAVVLCGAASAAGAACALQLDGDPEVVSPVREAVDAFRDDGATCVDVHALCSRDDAAIVVDLRDQLGRSVQRRFTTPEGAAAFLISWSRRALPQSGTGLEPDRPPPHIPAPDAKPPTRTTVPSVATSRPGTPPRGSAPPGATPPNSPPAAAPGPRIAIAAGIPGLTLGASLPTGETEPADATAQPGSGLQPEVRAAYISAPFGVATVDGVAAVLDATFLVKHDSLRAGLALRAIAANVAQQHFVEGTSHLEWLEFETELVVGTRWRFNRVVLGGELFGGVGGLSVISKTDSPLVDARTFGVRGGGRVVARSQLYSDVWFETRVAWDGLRQLGASNQDDEILRSDRYLGQLHLEIGLLWAP